MSLSTRLPSARRRPVRRPVVTLLGGLLVVASTTSALLPAAAAPDQAQAAGVVVDDPSFEAAVLADGEVGSLGGRWRGGSGTYNPTAAAYPALADQPTVGTMTGDDVAFLAGPAPAPLKQATTTAVVPGATYTLTVAVGGRSTGEKFAGLRMDLLLTGTSVASVQQAIAPVPGSFGDVSLTWTAPAGATGRVGLRIRALKPTANSYVDVDAVRLTAVTAPPPPVALPLVNPSFESVLVGDGGFGAVGEGWQGGSYAFNPSSAWYSGLAGQTAIGTMTGQNVALLYGSAPALQQTTSATVAARTTYTAVVAVGGRTSADRFAGLRLDLLAGGAVVATTTRPAPPLPGSFADVALSWTAPAGAGGALGVRISALAPSAGSYLDVDAVRLWTGTPPVVTVPVTITAPTSRQVVQRASNGRADVPVVGTAPGAAAVEARLVVRAGVAGVTTAWSRITVAQETGSFTGRIPSAQAGWYDVEVRVADPAAQGAGTVQRVGVGEVFIAAGQSNSSNWGQSPQTPGDDRVSALKAGLAGWQFAQDPQPTSDAASGSPWPAFGTRFATTTGIPVAIVSVGVGATTVQQWQPGGSLYPRIAAAMKALGPNGFRAVLWHQGEWDASACTPTATYATRLRSIIDGSRTDAGFTVPWGIATVSRLPGLSATCMAGVDAGQAQVVATTPATFTGPNTNGYLAAGLTYDNVHFSVAGLTAHGNAWVDAVNAWGGVPAR